MSECMALVPSACMSVECLCMEMSVRSGLVRSVMSGFVRVSAIELEEYIWLVMEDS